MLGIAKTEKKITFIRQDAIGTEEVTLDERVGSDVLEVIRLALGLGVATPEMLGAHPGLELSDDQEISTKSKQEDTQAADSMNTEDDPAQFISSSDISVSATSSEASAGKRKRGAATTSSNKRHRRLSRFVSPRLSYYLEFMLGPLAILWLHDCGFVHRDLSDGSTHSRRRVCFSGRDVGAGQCSNNRLWGRLSCFFIDLKCNNGSLSSRFLTDVSSKILSKRFSRDVGV